MQTFCIQIQIWTLGFGLFFFLQWILRLQGTCFCSRRRDAGHLTAPNPCNKFCSARWPSGASEDMARDVLRLSAEEAGAGQLLTWWSCWWEVETLNSQRLGNVKKQIPSQLWMISAYLHLLDLRTSRFQSEEICAAVFQSGPSSSSDNDPPASQLHWGVGFAPSVVTVSTPSNYHSNFRTMVSNPWIVSIIFFS